MFTEDTVKEGAVFNETDDESNYLVIEVHGDRDPAVALCRHLKVEGEETETEAEWALDYVERAVVSRNMFVSEGFADMDVYQIYKLRKSKLITALKYAKQSTKGTKKELLYRLLCYRNIHEIPSDVESCTDAESEKNATKESSEDLLTPNDSTHSKV